MREVDSSKRISRVSFGRHTHSTVQGHGVRPGPHDFSLHGNVLSNWKFLHKHLKWDLLTVVDLRRVFLEMSLQYELLMSVDHRHPLPGAVSHYVLRRS